ncbi:transcription initiation factor TFIID subunit A-domain-containing protein [Chaetomidium leptoderma]|uniref:Transcription initiation factor TFIID subunit A-domain-containing protein n=1 Tax=Chaetomidium leptoderma TaxID=669021 RepID=A0AAN6ZXZ9_9PEZI|nr:transcription initiation factor TFIID subunit A-domain-containing protein [Chaetomidium leptoderma]
MNPVPGQGMAGRANAPIAQVAGTPNRPQGGPPLYRPEMMRTITFLGEEEKTKYEKGLAGLWKVHDTAIPGSSQQDDAKKKISDFGRMLVAKIHQRRQQIQQQNQQQQQQQQLRQQQPLQQPGQTQAAPHPQQVSSTPGGGGPSSSMGNPASQSPAPGAQASPHLVAATAQARPQPANIISHVNDMQFHPPSNVTDKPKWLEEIKQKYARALMSMENARSTTKSIDQALQDNQSLPAEERKKLEERKLQLQKQYTEAHSFATVVRKQYGSGGNQRPAQNGAAGQNAANQGRPQTSGAQPGVVQHGQGASNGGAPAGAPANSLQSSTAAVNAAIEAAKKQQLAAGRVPGAVNALPAQQQGPPPPQPHHQSQVQQSPATPAQPQHSPVNQAPPLAQPVASHQQPQQSLQLQQPAPPIKIEPGTQPPMPAPLNTAIAAAAAGGHPSAGTPTQNSARLHTPQSATPTTANANIRPLTHAAAVNLASQPRPGANPTPPTTGPGITPSSGLGVIGAAQQQGHSHAHPPQPQPTPQNLQSKLPIPKVLHEKAIQMPTAVPNIGGIGSAGRPTYSGGGGIGGGVMNQPALTKTPAFQLEGEGERILNKKKLDELVRQVCGGTAEGQEGNLLTPEVEESVLTMADSFVDNVLHQACRNAKERGSKVLEIRDIQLVLERTYNIRIPGYSSEELRTVRKVQPNSSWIKKMSAVQAAKVVPGKGDL